MELLSILRLKRMEPTGARSYMAGLDSPTNQKQKTEAQAGDKPELTIENVGVSNFIVAGALLSRRGFSQGRGKAMANRVCAHIWTRPSTL